MKILKGILASLLVALPVAALSQGQMPPASVETEAVVLREIAPVYWASGTVVSLSDSQIAAEISGRLEHVVDVGVQVEKGDVLASLDDRQLQLQLRMDKAEIARLEADLDYQAKQLVRVESLISRNNSSQAELDRLRSDQLKTQQQIQAAKIRKEQTELDIAHATIVAPFAGVVASRQAEAGEFINRGQSVVRLVNMSRLEASVKAPVNTIHHSKSGLKVLVASDRYELEGQINRVVPVADSVSRMVEVRVTLPNGNWVVGEPVRASLAQGEPKTMLAVPRDALVLRQTETYVMKVGADNKAEKVVVEPGFGGSDYVGVIGNLVEGDKVIVRGGERLRAGQDIAALN